MKDLTIRDKIAIEAMNGILSGSAFTNEDYVLIELLDKEIKDLAAHAYSIADAMLKEREKKEGE